MIFRLPALYENSCENATWYFYNRLDYCACGTTAYPYEMHTDQQEMAPIVDTPDTVPDSLKAQVHSSTNTHEADKAHITCIAII
jgi:hypothetical protein